MRKRPSSGARKKVHSFIEAQTRQRREARRCRIADDLGLPLDHPEVTSRVDEWAVFDHPMPVINGEITAKWLRSIAALLDETDRRFDFVTWEARRYGSKGKRLSESEAAHASPQSKAEIVRRSGAGQKVLLAKRYLLEAAEVMWPKRKRRKRT
jgi:hypothetical protein